MPQITQTVKVENGSALIHGIWTTTVSNPTGGYTSDEVVFFEPSAASGIVTGFTAGPSAQLAFYVPGAAGTAQPVLQDTISGTGSGTLSTLSVIIERPTFVNDVSEGDLFTIRNAAGIRFVDSVDTQSRVSLIQGFGGTSSDSATGLFTTSFTPFLNIPLPDLGTLDHENVTRAALVVLDDAISNLDPNFGVGISGAPGQDGVLQSLNSLSQTALTIAGAGTISISESGGNTIVVSGTDHNTISALGDLSDVDTGGVQEGQFLVKGAGDWTATSSLVTNDPDIDSINTVTGTMTPGGSRWNCHRR